VAISLDQAAQVNTESLELVPVTLTEVGSDCGEIAEAI
jgi:hypothetical protein